MFEHAMLSLAEAVQEDWVPISAAVVSVTSAIMAAAQRRQQMKIGWLRELVAWAKDAMLALAAAQVEIGREMQSDPYAAQRRADIRTQLSAAVDHGRLFFENSRSFRPDVLDPLVRAFDLLVAIDAFPEKYTREHLVACMNRHRTEFWQLVQAKVDPAWVRKAVQGPHALAGAGAWDFDKAHA